MSSSSDRPVIRDERENHGPALPPPGGMFGLEAGGSLQVFHPCSLSTITPLPASVHDTWHGARCSRRMGGDIYIHLGGRKVRRAGCGRQTGSGGLGA